MSRTPRGPASTPKSPIPVVINPATHVTVFTVMERSGGLAGRVEGAFSPLSGSEPLFVSTAKNTLSVRRVKWAGGIELDKVAGRPIIMQVS